MSLLPSTSHPIGLAGHLSATGSANNSDSACAHDSKIAKIAARVARDPLLMRQLSERVYQLLLADLHYQKERYSSYRGPF